MPCDPQSSVTRRLSLEGRQVLLFWQEQVSIPIISGWVPEGVDTFCSYSCDYWGSIPVLFPLENIWARPSILCNCGFRFSFTAFIYPVENGKNGPNSHCYLFFHRKREWMLVVNARKSEPQPLERTLFFLQRLTKYLGEYTRTNAFKSPLQREKVLGPKKNFSSPVFAFACFFSLRTQEWINGSWACAKFAKGSFP